jgi:hypothetical protein
MSLVGDRTSWHRSIGFDGSPGRTSKQNTRHAVLIPGRPPLLGVSPVVWSRVGADVISLRTRMAGPRVVPHSVIVAGDRSVPRMKSIADRMLTSFWLQMSRTRRWGECPLGGIHEFIRGNAQFPSTSIVFRHISATIYPSSSGILIQKLAMSGTFSTQPAPAILLNTYD